MDQSILDRIVKIATAAAMSGKPVERIVWIPPAIASSGPTGTFITTPCRTLSAANTPTWDR